MGYRTSSRQSVANLTAVSGAVIGSSPVVSASTGPVVYAIYVTDSSYANLDDTAVNTSGGYIKLVGTNFVSGCSLYINGVLVASTFVSSTEVRAQVAVAAAGTYSVMLFNTVSSGCIFGSGLVYSGFPSFSSTSYSNSGTVVSTQLLVTGDAPLTFSLQAGSTLPAGLVLSGSGLISGTASGASATTVTVLVDDAQKQTFQQTITLTIVVGEPYFAYTTLLLSGDGSNNATNNTFVDSSTNNFAITRAGNTTQGTFSPYGANWSNYFNGSSYLTAGTTASNFLCTGSASGITATLEAWVYLTAYNTGGSPWMFSPVHSKGVTYFNFGVRNGAVRFYWFDGVGPNTVDSASTSDVPLNTWTHIAVTISGTTIKIYVNGTLSTTSATYNGVAAAGSGGAENIGFEGNQPTYFSGYISNYRLTNTIVYTSTFTPSTTPLTAISGTRLLTCQLNRFVDTSTNLFAVTKTGSTSVQRFNPLGNGKIPYTAGTIGGSAYFNGSTDYLSVADNANLEVGSGDFTLEGWFYATAAGAGDNIIVTKCSAAYAPYWVSFYGGNSIKFCASSTNGSWDVANNISFGAPTLTAWNHFAVSRSGTAIQLFLNGVLGATVTTSAALTDHSSPFTVGSQFSGGNPFTGYISNVRLVKGTAVYTTAFTPPSTPVTAVTNTSLLLNFANASIIDGAMINNLETFSGAKISTTQSKFGGSSIAFNGSTDYLTCAASPNLDMGAGDFTIEAWVYSISVANNYPTFLSSITGWSAGASGHRFNNTGYASKFWFGLNGSGGVASGDPFMASANTFSFNTWHHYALTRSGNTWRMFVNGNLETTQTYSGAYNPAYGGLRAGWSTWDAANGYFNGYVDDLRITKGFARYTANFTPPAALIAQ